MPEDCPRCAVVWRALEVVDPYLDLETEFDVAHSLLDDYGRPEMIQHLTSVMERAQILKHRLGL